MALENDPTIATVEGSALNLQPLALADRRAWDSLARSFMQSWAWAEFKELEGYRTFRYGLFAGHDRSLVGGCIFYFYPHAQAANLLMAPGGPVWSDRLTPEEKQAGLRLLLHQAEALGRELGAIALRVEPGLDRVPEYLSEFRRSPADLLPSETLVVDLTPSPEAILAAMKPKGRYNIRLSQRHGIRTEFTTDPQAIPGFYDVFWETVQRQRFFGEPYGFFINLCQTLFAAGMAELGFATYGGKVVSAVLLVYWNGCATYLYGGHTRRYPHTMANYGLHWAAMERARSRGCQRYDLYGFTRDQTHGYARFSQFKRQFGGQVMTTIGAWDYFFYDQLADRVAAVFDRLKLR